MLAGSGVCSLSNHSRRGGVVCFELLASPLPAWAAPRRALNPAITKDTCVTFLRWGLPQLELRWPGYRKVCRLVGKRLSRRLVELGLADLSAYRAFLISAPEEWARLDVMCRIPISRFYRDRGTFDFIAQQLPPEVAATASAKATTRSGAGARDAPPARSLIRW
jgi:hypothetical protein